MIKELFDDFFNRDSTGMDKTDFWVPLLEKAFAKFCGSYRMLIAGHPVRGLSYLTGGICVRMTLVGEGHINSFRISNVINDQEWYLLAASQNRNDAPNNLAIS